MPLGCWEAQRGKGRKPAFEPCLLHAPDFLIPPSPSETGATITSTARHPRWVAWGLAQGHTAESGRCPLSPPARAAARAQFRPPTPALSFLGRDLRTASPAPAPAFVPRQVVWGCCYPCWVSAASCAFRKEAKGQGHPQTQWRSQVTRKRSFGKQGHRGHVRDGRVPREPPPRAPSRPQRSRKR